MTDVIMTVRISAATASLIIIKRLSVPIKVMIVYRVGIF
jgi:hypothetical protein